MSESNTSQAGVTKLYGSDSNETLQREAFLNGEIPVAVYGLGKMGLPLASVFAETCGNVIGADINPEVVATIQSGNSHIKREPGLGDLVEKLVTSNDLRATKEPREAVQSASVHVVIVPTPITDEKEPDLAILDAVVSDIATGLDEGDLVLIECTVPPKTTEERVFEQLKSESSLSEGEFGVAFCPERTSSGRALKDIRGAYPKVVGGVDAESTRAASIIYSEVNSEGVLEVSDATTAEAIKVFEGVYRDVNIALANELAQFTDELGIDVREAIEVANTQPFCNIHDPGPGVGGHCIPYYPYFLIKPFDAPSPLLSTARSVNDSMPEFTVSKVCEGLQTGGIDVENATVVIFGLTYRPGVEEIRASPSIPISRELTQLGADVYGVDPVLETFEAFSVEPITIEDMYQLDIDAVVLVTPHNEFELIRWNELETSENGPFVVIDGRATLDDMNLWCYTIGSGANN
ncbi:nucleotide sugar dehydrogenase [Natronosalvus halobius]|uniref:nucleotide sugar dehydrogenase n=1 Tax=Natronosalvus halobius TaxID=2953746 RepID=UPI00209DB16B|nr:nucleotide sugar dehydrogenase [Natronosalvus halobius]USZ71479.1 nucleotide sugar dehydrogenase [Natronosalvus halobius]